MTRWVVLSLLVACRPVPTPGAGAGADDSGTSTDSGDAATTEPLNAEAAQAGAVVAWDALLTSDPRVPQRHYEALRRTGDSQCPRNSGSYSGQFYWDEGCTADNGTTFDGWVLSNWQQDWPANEEGRHYHAIAWYYGMARVTDGAGNRFEGWGSNALQSWQSLDGATRGYQAAVGGDFSWSGADPEWLDTAVDQGWEMAAERRPDGSLRWSATGGIGLLDGVFDAFALSDAVLDAPAGSCQAEPHASVRFRQAASGTWYTAVFDGDGCDGCGEMTARVAGDDLPIGTICLDWTPLLDWEIDPWAG